MRQNLTPLLLLYENSLFSNLTVYIITKIILFFHNIIIICTGGVLNKVLDKIKHLSFKAYIQSRFFIYYMNMNFYLNDK